MGSIPFTKMHGLGNDYIYVDCFHHSLAGLDAPALSRAMSDRHRGIGSDGLILICPPTSGTKADARMEMYNADGSRGEMCGNGIRCVAKYVLDHGIVHKSAATPARPSALTSELNHAMAFLGETLAANEIGATDLKIETDRGVLDLVAFSANGIVQSVRVNMGTPILRPGDIPVSLPGETCIRAELPLADRRLRVTCVSMGNPHAVAFIDDVSRFDLSSVGPTVERHAIFPNRVNFHVVTVHSPGEATMRTWERGSGITQACGTGACAVLVAGVLEDRLSRSARIHLPGGDLTIEWPEAAGSDHGPVFMTGPAVEVFSGQWPA